MTQVRVPLVSFPFWSYGGDASEIRGASRILQHRDMLWMKSYTEIYMLVVMFAHSFFFRNVRYVLRGVDIFGVIAILRLARRRMLLCWLFVSI